MCVSSGSEDLCFFGCHPPRGECSCATSYRGHSRPGCLEDIGTTRRISRRSTFKSTVIVSAGEMYEMLAFGARALTFGLRLLATVHNVHEPNTDKARTETDRTAGYNNNESGTTAACPSLSTQKPQETPEDPWPPA